MARVDWVIVHHGPLPVRQVTAGHERESETGYSADLGSFLFFLRAKRQGVMKSKETWYSIDLGFLFVVVI